MKSKSQLITFILMYLVIFLVMRMFWANPARTNKVAAPALMSQAEKKVEDKEYKAAVGIYQRVTSNFPASQEALQAQFAIAELQETKLNNKLEAVNVYRRVEHWATQKPGEKSFVESLKERFSGPSPNFYGKNVEIRQDGRTVSVSAADEAKVRLVALEKAMDKANSRDWKYQIMDFLVKLTGGHRWSYVIAILVLTVFIKIITTPLTKKQYSSMMEMQKVQPLLKQLQEKYKDNPQELNRRSMELYREHGVNPFAGCLPLLIQMPILFGLYATIRLYQFQFAKGSFLWINDLSAPDIPLLLLYAVSMYFSTKLTSLPSQDPGQQQQQKMMAIMMPVMFTFFIWSLPSAFVLYWFAFNVLTTWQTYHILRHARAEQEAAGVNAIPAESGSNGKDQISPSQTGGGPKRVKARRRPARK